MERQSYEIPGSDNYTAESQSAGALFQEAMDTLPRNQNSVRAEEPNFVEFTNLVDNDAAPKGVVESPLSKQTATEAIKAFDAMVFGLDKKQPKETAEAFKAIVGALSGPAEKTELLAKKGANMPIVMEQVRTLMRSNGFGIEAIPLKHFEDAGYMTLTDGQGRYVNIGYERRPTGLHVLINR